MQPEFDDLSNVLVVVGSAAMSMRWHVVAAHLPCCLVLRPVLLCRAAPSVSMKPCPQVTGRAVVEGTVAAVVAVEVTGAVAAVVVRLQNSSLQTLRCQTAGMSCWFATRANAAMAVCNHCPSVLLTWHNCMSFHPCCCCGLALCICSCVS